MHPLFLYLVTVLTAVAPALPADRRDSIAQDIAQVTLAEDRAFDGDADGQQTALLLVALAHYETGRSWARWIDDGSCNDPAWRARYPNRLRGGDCDGGRAWGMWQVHVAGDDPAVGRRLVADRKNGIRAALEIARSSLRSGDGLCHYSGESAPHCPLADRRLSTAREWVREYPYQPDTDPAAGVE